MNPKGFTITKNVSQLITALFFFNAVKATVRYFKASLLNVLPQKRLKVCKPIRIADMSELYQQITGHIHNNGLTPQQLPVLEQIILVALRIVTRDDSQEVIGDEFGWTQGEISSRWKLVSRLAPEILREIPLRENQGRPISISFLKKMATAKLSACQQMDLLCRHEKGERLPIADRKLLDSSSHRQGLRQSGEIQRLRGALVIALLHRGIESPALSLAIATLDFVLGELTVTEFIEIVEQTINNNFDSGSTVGAKLDPNGSF
jgi:hypothetical protein